MVVEHKIDRSAFHPRSSPSRASPRSTSTTSTPPPSTACQAVGPGERSQGQHRSQPRHPGRPQLEHEIAIANSLGIFGSIDMNRGDMQCGWGHRPVPQQHPRNALALYYILQAAAFHPRPLNFDAKARRQSLDAEDMFHAHIGGMDVCARALLIAEAMIRTAPWPSSSKTATPPGKPLGPGRAGRQSNLDAVANMALERKCRQGPGLRPPGEFPPNWVQQVHLST